VGGVTLPSLAAYQILFALCAAAAVLGACIALLVPYPAGYSPRRAVMAAVPGWPAGTSLPPAPGPASLDERRAPDR
jgi:hypothetical protein